MIHEGKISMKVINPKTLEDALKPKAKWKMKLFGWIMYTFFITVVVYSATSIVRAAEPPTVEQVQSIIGRSLSTNLYCNSEFMAKRYIKKAMENVIKLPDVKDFPGCNYNINRGDNLNVVIIEYITRLQDDIGIMDIFKALPLEQKDHKYKTYVYVWLPFVINRERLKEMMKGINSEEYI